MLSLLRNDFRAICCLLYVTIIYYESMKLNMPSVISLNNKLHYFYLMLVVVAKSTAVLDLLRSMLNINIAIQEKSRVKTVSKFQYIIIQEEMRTCRDRHIQAFSARRQRLCWSDNQPSVAKWDQVFRNANAFIAEYQYAVLFQFCLASIHNFCTIAAFFARVIRAINMKIWINRFEHLVERTTILAFLIWWW